MESVMYLDMIETKFSPEHLSYLFAELSRALEEKDLSGLRRILGEKINVEPLTKISSVGPMRFTGRFSREHDGYNVAVNDGDYFMYYTHTELMACFLALIVENCVNMEFTDGRGARWGYAIKPGVVYKIIYEDRKSRHPIALTKRIKREKDMGYYSEMYMNYIDTEFSPKQLEGMYVRLEGAIERGDEKEVSKLLGVEGKRLKALMEIKSVGPMEFTGKYSESEGRYYVDVNSGYPHVDYRNTDLMACFLSTVVLGNVTMEFVGEGSDRWGYEIKPGAVYEIIYEITEDRNPHYKTKENSPYDYS